MSIPVELETLAEVITRYRFAYLMTVTDKGTPHVVQVAAVMQGSELMIDYIGRRTHGNILARPTVGLVWPPLSETDYSLIVDGRAARVGDSVRITPTRAVLHRPASSPQPAETKSCGSDCMELNLTPSLAKLKPATQLNMANDK